MTISYTLDIASSSPINFVRVLKRWRGSIWKSVSAELLLWITAYLVIAVIYRNYLSPEAQLWFNEFAKYCRSEVGDIPLTFMLGFFVNIIIQRWTDAFKNMGYLENQAIHISSMVVGAEEEARLIRRTLVRYLCLTQVLVFRDISVRVRKRFPTLESVVIAGFMLPHELEKLNAYKTDFDKFWVPINWAFALVVKARQEGKIKADNYAVKICDEIKIFRNNLQMLCNYDWVEIPLSYPQVVFLSVHTYFLVCLFGRQFLLQPETITRINGTDVTSYAPPPLSKLDLYIPFMTILQYLFFVGWMKVAEGLLNPFGEDDDDFECNFLIDKNFATCLCIVDEAHGDLPPVQKDRFWYTKEVEAIYSKAAAGIPINPLIGSAARAAKLEPKDKKAEEPEMVVLMTGKDANSQASSSPPSPAIKRSVTVAPQQHIKKAARRALNTLSFRVRRNVAPTPDYLKPDPNAITLEEGGRQKKTLGSEDSTELKDRETVELASTADITEETSSVLAPAKSGQQGEERKKKGDGAEDQDDRHPKNDGGE